MIRSLAALTAFGYWAWATVALGASYLALAASEQSPFDAERFVLWLAGFSWLLATFIVFVLARRPPAGRLLAALWLVQGALLMAALGSTLDFGGIRIAPPLIAFGVAGQLAGLLAIVEHSFRQPRS